MKKTVLVTLLILAFSVAACSPVTIQKCQKDIKYDKDGKKLAEYTECVTQTPEKMSPLHLKHQELYE
jgi:predicted small secreted protein